MRVCVIGAGVVGVTTAWELASAGHQVTVIEQRDGVAGECSFGGGGFVAPGLATLGAAAGLPANSLRALFDVPGAVRLPPAPRTLSWLRRWNRARPDAVPMRCFDELAQFGRARLAELRDEHRLGYERCDGALVLLRSVAQWQACEAQCAQLESLGVRHAVVDAKRCREIEPGLADEPELAGGVHLPDAEIGNCRQFAQSLKVAAQRRGVEFRFLTRVARIEPGAQPSVTAEPSSEPRERGRPAEPASTEHYDAVVVCAALGAPALLRPLGLALPLLPVWGYSITAPLRHFEAHPDVGPRSGVVDAAGGIMISRLGARVRVAGRFEVGGSPERLDPRAIDALHRSLHEWFPGVANLAQVQRWKGARPLLPHGAPLVGGTRWPGIWLNLGHGANGWALACGCAQLIAGAFSGEAAPIDVTPFAIERLGTA